MKIGETLSVFSQVINFMIFIYFIITLLNLEILDVWGLLISAFGLFSSIIVNIISVIENRRSRMRERML